MLKDDIDNWKARKGRPHYGIMQHLLIISQRLDRLDADLLYRTREHLRQEFGDTENSPGNTER